ncbi:MAG: PAS domain-containing protein [Spirochaetia bacterium]|nr:PAS domain-containing protein [Spirochaetia bacterium]
MKTKSRSIVSYLLPPMVLLFIILAGSVAFFSYRNLSSLLYSEYYNRLESTAAVLQAALPDTSDELRRYAPQVCTEFGKKQEIRLTFISPDGTVFADTHENPSAMENHATRVEIRQALNGEDAFSLRESPTLSIPMLYHGTPLRNSDGKIIAVLRSSIPARRIESLLGSAALSIALITAVLLLFSVLAMVLVSRKITVPLSRIAKYASSYGEFDFSQSVKAEGPREIVTTANALQKMARALTSRIGKVSSQKQELEAILTGMNEGVIVLDHNLVITELNPAAVKLINYSSEPIIGKSLIQVMRNTDIDNFALETLTAKAVRQSSFVIAVEGEQKHLQINAATIEAVLEGVYGRNEIQRLVLVLNDITHLKRLENIRKEFVANVSHELKTPITSIGGFVETLLDGAIEDKDTAQRFLHIIHNQVDRLGNIIEDLLTLSRLEQNEGGQGITFEQIELINPVQEAVSMCRRKASENSIEIRVDCETGLEIYGNSRLIGQAVFNLLNNAVKYCPEQSVVQVKGERDADGQVRLAVRDNGPGIPEADRSRIFERFYRVEKARSRDAGGTGLGLAIVKHIMITHGGSVELESGDSAGTSFLLRFPA